MRLWILSVVCLLLTTTAWAVKVHLKDGTVISGKIENADREKVEITTSLGIKMSIPRESIAEIEYEPGEEQIKGLEESKKLVIAVVDFTNVGNDPQLEGLVKGIPESVTTYLGKKGKVRIVERSRLEAALKELQLGMTGIVDEETAARVGKAVGASAIMVGSFLKIGDLIRINARLIDVQTGEVIMADQVQGRFEEVFGLMDQVAERIWKKLTGQKGAIISTGNELPKIIVLIQEILDGKPSKSLNAERTLIKALRQKSGRFLVLDSEAVFHKLGSSEIKAALTGDIKAVTSMGLTVGADLVIVGTADIHHMIKEVYGTVWKFSRVRVSAYIISAKTGKTIASVSSSSEKSLAAEQQTGVSALEEACSKIVDQMLPKLFDWQGERK